VNPTAQSTRQRTGFRDAEQGARSASPMPLEGGGSTRRWRRRSGCETRSPTRRTRSPVLTAAFRREREGRDEGRVEGLLSTRRAPSLRDAPNFQANNPLFKERAPELHVAFRSSLLSPEGRRVSRFMTLHSLRITLARLRNRRVTPTPRANRLSSDAPFSDRFLPDRMNGAGIGRPGAPSTAESTLFARTSFLARS